MGASGAQSGSRQSVVASCLGLAHWHGQLLEMRESKASGAGPIRSTLTKDGLASCISFMLSVTRSLVPEAVTRSLPPRFPQVLLAPPAGSVHRIAAGSSSQTRPHSVSDLVPRSCLPALAAPLLTTMTLNRSLDPGAKQGLRH